MTTDDFESKNSEHHEAQIHPIHESRRHRHRRRLTRGIVLVPSLLTAAALFSGFFSIISTLNAVISGHHDFKMSVYAIIFAAIFDSFDGRMARLMNAESEFGSHFDSISDVVSFGVAPAVLIFSMALAPLGRLGWLGAFLFLACAAIRLARFNIVSREAPSKKYFKGMSSPVAAAGLGVTAWILQQELPTEAFQYTAFGVSALLSLLMVSNVRFRSFKDLHFRSSPVQIFLLIILSIVCVVSFGEYALMLFFLIYLASGLLEEIILWRRRRRSDPSVPFLPFGDR